MGRKSPTMAFRTVRVSQFALRRGFSTAKPAERPACPNFSSGPCTKRPGYDIAALDQSVLGRSHRSKVGKSMLKQVIVDTKRILGIPEDYLVGIVPASDTGAYEMAMWSMLGERPVDICHWESFGKGWFWGCNVALEAGERDRAYCR